MVRLFKSGRWLKGVGLDYYKERYVTVPQLLLIWKSNVQEYTSPAKGVDLSDGIGDQGLTFPHASVGKLVKPSDLGSEDFVGSSPTRGTFGSIVQLEECLNTDQVVGGSNPSRASLLLW